MAAVHLLRIDVEAPTRHPSLECGGEEAVVAGDQDPGRDVRPRGQRPRQDEGGAGLLYTDLQSDLSGISPTVLSARLRELTDSGVVTHRCFPRPTAGMAYELTDWGRGLEAVLLDLGAWGSESPTPAAAAPLGLDSLVLALRSRLRTTQIDGDPAVVQLNVGDDVLTMSSDHGRVHLRRGEAHTPDATLTASTLTLQDLAFTDRTLDDAVESGDATLTGDTSAARQLLSLICSDRA